jgi:hypothetical protein
VPIIVLHSDEKRHWWESVNGIIKDENKPVQAGSMLGNWSKQPQMTKACTFWGMTL